MKMQLSNLIKKSVKIPSVIKYYCAIVFLVLSLPSHSAKIKPFTTDGCSSFPDGIGDDNALWINCCIRHDFAYWKGGTSLEKEKADFELKQCVADLGEKEIAKLMSLGVKLGGSAYYPTSYRWGYGWPYSRGYKALTKEEGAHIKEQLEVLKKLIDEFIGETESLATPN